MKVLDPGPQPVPTLIALGVITVLPLSWSTDHRGPLAIYAGAGVTGRTGEWRPYGDCDGRHDGFYMTDGEDRGLAVGRIVPLPRRSIVATCTLVDVVPVLAPGTQEYLDIGMRTYVLLPEFGNPNEFAGHLRLCRYGAGWPDDEIMRDIDDQGPYGAFVPGRFAWVLADVVPLVPPVPFTVTVLLSSALGDYP